MTDQDAAYVWRFLTICVIAIGAGCIMVWGAFREPFLFWLGWITLYVLELGGVYRWVRNHGETAIMIVRRSFSNKPNE